MTEQKPKNVEVKICGIKDKRGFNAALKYDVDYIGLIFVEGSPRYISPKDAADLLQEFNAEIRPKGRQVVAVMADPTDKELAEVLTKVSPSILQLHGKETPERIREIGGVYDIRMMKALPVSTQKDLARAKDYVGYADMLLFDAKAEDGSISGGKGVPFDWTLMEHLEIGIPWFLSGGLNPDNVREAIDVTGAKRVDVSSGVEKEKGEKDTILIRHFMKAAKPNDEEEDDR